MNQHRSFFIIVLLLTCFFSAEGRARVEASKEGVTMLGSVVFPRGLSFVPSLTMLYKGAEYTIHSKDQQKKKSPREYFELYDIEKHHTFYIVVTEDLQVPISKNITSLETSPNHGYRLFKIQRVIDDAADVAVKGSEDLVTWEITELDNSIVGWKIPDNAIILLMDPMFVDSLENVTWHSNQSTIKLPAILFKKTVDAAAFREAADKVQVALINFKFMHKKPTAQIVPYQNRTIAMPHWAGRAIA